MLAAGKLRVSVKKPARIRVWKALCEFDEPYAITSRTGWNETTSVLGELPDRLANELGIENLMAWPEEGGPARPADLEAFVLRTYIPAQLFDALELFYSDLPESIDQAFQHRLNDIFDESDLAWRMANGKIFPIDSEYAEEEINKRAFQLIREVGFEGALHEFEKARTDLVNGNAEGAINNANLSVESVIKGILGIKRAKPGSLFRELIDSGIIPEYFDGFISGFEENIVRCINIARNEELGAAHGQGIERNIIPDSLAEFVVHMAAVLNIFLIKRHLEGAGSQVEGEDGECVEDDEIIF